MRHNVPSQARPHRDTRHMTQHFARPALALPLLLLGCTEGDPSDEPQGVAALGGGTHDVAALTLTVLGTSDDGLDVPRDLAFNPDVPGELWVVNRGDDGVVIFDDADSSDSPSSAHIVDPYALHFMEEVSSIAFGAPGTFGTCQESRNTYNGQAPHDDFMGPALWSSDREIFGETNPEAVNSVGYDLGSHLDMLHESPYCMGIAWQEDNIYWVADGNDGAIVRYDFLEDHGPGFDDHTDGVIARALVGELDREPGVPSHMKLDRATGWLYIADTGNSRVIRIDTRSGTRGDDLPTITERPADWEEHYALDDVTVEEIVDGSAVNLEQPTGLALHGGNLFVSDYDQGLIFAFTLDGELLDWLELDRGESIMGLTFDEAGNLYVVDAREDEVLRFAAP